MTADAMQQMEVAQCVADIRTTASLIYAQAIAPYIQGILLEPAMAKLGGKPDPALLHSFAVLAVKCAPYLAQAQGRWKINEEKLWADLQVTPAPVPTSAIIDPAD